MIDIEKVKKESVTNNFISSVYYFEETDSTNTFAKSQPGDVLVISEYQSKGKGRFVRTWHSEKESNLTFSVKKTIHIPAEKISYVNYFFSYYTYAVLYDLLESCKADTTLLKIKWPNDILYGGKKICGILTESNLQKNEFTIGIGININQREFPPELNAVSVYSITGKKSDNTALLITLLKTFSGNFERLLNTEALLFTDWKKSSGIIGKSVNITRNANNIAEAKVLDLQEDGGIVLQIKGKRETFYSGEVKITN